MDENTGSFVLVSERYPKRCSTPQMSSQRSDWRERLHANPSRMEQELAIKLQEDGICSRDIKSSRVSRHNTAETETAGRLGSFDVCNSKLELQCLSCHRMVATPP